MAARDGYSCVLGCHNCHTIATLTADIKCLPRLQKGRVYFSTFLSYSSVLHNDIKKFPYVFRD